MTEEIRKRIEQAMVEQGKRRTDLSQETGIKPPNMARMLNGRSGEVPKNWQKIFDALGLELSVTQKGKTHD